MKNFWILILLVYASVCLSQKDTLYVYQLYHSFSNEQKAEWTAFENNWNYFEYSKLLKQEKIKTLNCSRCESFFADVYLEIDHDGKVSVAQFKNGKKCGLAINDKVLMLSFENSLSGKTFKTLKNMHFIMRLGHVLKC